MKDNDIPMITMWCGKPLSELSKDQLIEIIITREEQHRQEVAMLQQSRRMWMHTAFDVAKEAAA